MSSTALAHDIWGLIPESQEILDSKSSFVLKSWTERNGMVTEGSSSEQDSLGRGSFMTV